jgi:hypothetical protein
LARGQPARGLVEIGRGSIACGVVMAMPAAAIASIGR